MTRMHHPTFVIITFSLLLLAFLFSNALATNISIDKTATVSTVIDGSTFTLNSGETVKLAAIDTPPLGYGYTESRNYLTSMIQGKTVYLDIDTITITDQGRLLCVAYLDYNSTHYENVNMAMIQNSYAVPSSVSNTKFNPTTWTWFVPKETPTSSPTISPSTPTATPTATPFSPPTPSVSPDVPELSAFLSILIIGMTTLLIGAKFYGKKGKK